MALRVCKECGSEVSNTARRCPKCGNYIWNKGRMGCAIFIIFILILFFIGLCKH